MKLPNAISPFSVATRLVGINPISRRSKVYLILAFTCRLLLILKAWHYELRHDQNNFWFTVFVYSIQDALRVSADFVGVITTFLDPKRYMIPLKDFQILDETLENLGIHVDDTGAYRLQILHLVFFGVVSFLMSVWYFYSLVQLYGISEYLGIAMMVVVSSLMIIYSFVVVDCSFCTVLLIIRKRFKLINMIIRRAENHRPRANVEVTENPSEITEDIVLRELKMLREQYHELWDISSRVNEAFGLHLLVTVAASLTLVTVSLWQAYTLSTNDVHDLGAIGSQIFWAVFYTMRLFLLAQVCEFTLTEAKVTGIVLQELLMKGECCSRTESEIRDFLSQHELEVQEFTACKFFEVNSKMFHAILNAVSTYLVILIQMGEDDNS